MLYTVESGGDEELIDARERLLALGDMEGAATADVYLGYLYWGRGDQVTAIEHMKRAVGFVEGRPPSEEKAYALASLASRYMTASEDEKSIRLSREALRIYEDLGDEQGRAESLNTLGVSRMSSGDRGGLDDLEQSIEIGRAKNLPRALGRACLNLASVLQLHGDFSRTLALFAESAEAWERSGNHLMARWMPAEIGVDRYLRGDWDEAVALFDAFLGQEDADPHYMETVCRACRGRIRVARGDIDGGLDDATRAVDLARPARDPQALYPSVALAALSLLDVGRQAEAERLAEDVLIGWREAGHQYPPSFWAVYLALVLGDHPGLCASLESSSTTNWLPAAKAITTGDVVAAADTLGAIGAIGDEAYCRLRAAESFAAGGRSAEAASELERATAFFQGVRASAFLQRCEFLRAA